MKDQLKKKLEEIRARIAARLKAAEDRNETLSSDEITANDSDEADYASTERTLHALERQEARVAAAAAAPLETARPVAQRQLALPAAVRAAVNGGPAILTRTTAAQRAGDKFKGQTGLRITLARLASALSLKSGEYIPAHEIAASRWPDRPEISAIIKLRSARYAADMTGGGIGSGDWGAELLQLNAEFSGDFVEFLYADTVFERLALRTIPADVTVKGQDGAATAYFVGEMKAIPMTSMSFSDVTLRRLKCAALVAMSRDLIERSSPDAESLAGTALKDAIGQKVDGLFFSTTAASSAVAPAGILNGITGHASAGGTLSDLYADLRTLAATFISAKNAGGGHVYVSDKNVGEQIGTLLDGFGHVAFPDIDENGGTLRKKPYYTGDNVPSGNLIRLKPSDIYKIGDSGTRIELSTDATLEFGTEPTAAGDVPTDQSENPISLFQTDMVAIKVLRDINWATRRSAAIVVDRITGADYDGTHSTTD